MNKQFDIKKVALNEIENVIKLRLMLLKELEEIKSAEAEQLITNATKE